MTDAQKALLAMAHERLERTMDFAAAKRHPRFEVGDAYYTMFYCATAALLGKGISHDKHGGVISSFAREFCKTNVLSRDLATYLRAAMDARHEGDYDWDAEITVAEADLHLSHAEQFLSEVEKHLAI